MQQQHQRQPQATSQSHRERVGQLLLLEHQALLLRLSLCSLDRRHVAPHDHARVRAAARQQRLGRPRRRCQRPHAVIMACRDEWDAAMNRQCKGRSSELVLAAGWPAPSVLRQRHANVLLLWASAQP